MNGLRSKRRKRAEIKKLRKKRLAKSARIVSTERAEGEEVGIAIKVEFDK
jgi:hypothetical protein